jgi:hypothetical protein
MRTFWDGINSDAPFIPTTAQGVMGYVPPSSFAWTPASWARFPNSTLVRITPSASVFGPGVHMLDIETGDATPAQAPGWAANSRRARQDPTVYCSLSAWPAVQAAFNAAKVPHPHYVIAHYDGNPTTMPVLNGIVAVGKQYLSTARYDLTAVPGAWPGVDPTTPTTVTPGKADDMPQLLVPAGDNDHVELIVEGCTAIYFGTGYGDALTLHQLDWFGATPAAPAPATGGIGGEWTESVIDPNRPGPLPIPAGSVVAVIRYTANHAWTLAAR